jgi:riboflavin kinase/FMN adenylyltransferase
MQLLSSNDHIPEQARGAVVVIGNFDGVHKGHQALFAAARDRARTIGAPFAVLTFEPHPKRFFMPDAPPFRITPRLVKQRQLAGLDADYVIEMTFDQGLASMSPKSFIDDVLSRDLGVAEVFVGHDFRFGHKRAGSAETLQHSTIPTTVIEQVGDEGDSVYASRRVRELLEAGDIDAANAILGWHWEIEGVVTHGDKRGRELGYPTANLALGETIHPAYGVYAGRVCIDEEARWRPAALNIGVRPMFEVETGLVEAYLLNFDGDLYDRTLRVQPVAKIRDEQKFDDLDALKARMAEDCRQAETMLAEHVL